jgi:hypothetical protein
MGINMKGMLGNASRPNQTSQDAPTSDRYMMQEEEERLIDMDQVARSDRKS